MCNLKISTHPLISLGCKILYPRDIIYLIKYTTSDNAILSLNLGYHLIYLSLTLYGKRLRLALLN